MTEKEKETLEAIGLRLLHSLSMSQAAFNNVMIAYREAQALRQGIPP